MADCSVQIGADPIEQDADLAEAEAEDDEFQKLVDGEIQIGGEIVKVAEFVIDCDSQSLFEDTDVPNQQHPKLRRIIASRMTAKTDASSRKIAGAAQKAVERDRVQETLTGLSDSWREYLNSALVKQSRASVLAELQPGVADKGNKAQKSLKKLLKPVSRSGLG
jgi:hypothetical protein